MRIYTAPTSWSVDHQRCCYSPCTDLVNGQPYLLAGHGILVTGTIGRLVHHVHRQPLPAAAPAIASPTPRLSRSLAVVSAYTPPERSTAHGTDFGPSQIHREVFNLSNINSVTWAVSRISGRTAISAISSVQPTANDFRVQPFQARLLRRSKRP